ncbi:MAG: T9SS type A sorting domain-containing protein [Bacteroidota bacterium]
MKTSILFQTICALAFFLTPILSHAQNNTIYGSGAGISLTGGSFNTLTGYRSGYRTTSGSGNTFYGAFSGGSNTTGSRNTAIGLWSGINGRTGSENTYVGAFSGFANTTGESNTFIGTSSGFNNSTGGNNTYIGYYSGRNSRTGLGNTFVGSNSGENNTEGGRNTFLGWNSGYATTTGSSNIFIGSSSGTENISGNDNTFLGNGSGYYNDSGSQNIFLGYQSGINNTRGSNNVYIGYQAGYTESGGANNRFIVDNFTEEDDTPLLYGDFSRNSLAVGTKYTGSTYQFVVEGKVRAREYWVKASPRDREVSRSEKQVNAAGGALARLQQLESVGYQQPVQNAKKGKKRTTNQPVTYELLAESMEETFPDLVKEEGAEVALNYQGLIPVLVEAVKELSQAKDTSQMQQQLTLLLEENAVLQQRLAAIEQVIKTNNLTSPFGSELQGHLDQNWPNPVSSSTRISYQTNGNVRDISVELFDISGQPIASYKNLTPGRGEVEILGSQLVPGTYIYQLKADGKVIDSKRMLVAR